MNTHTHTHIYIYTIHIYRERERERDIYIYIVIYYVGAVFFMGFSWMQRPRCWAQAWRICRCSVHLSWLRPGG